MANVVEVILAGKDQLSGPMGVANKALMAGAAAIAALSAAAGLSLRAFATFESAIARIEGLSNTGKDTLVKWKDEILRLGPALGQTPQALAQAMFFISSAGLSSAAAMDTLKMSAMAASAGLGDMNAIARTVISAQNAYGEANLSARQATDTLVAAVREGNVQTEEFAGTIGRVFPVASQLGVSMGEVAGAIAAMTNIGLDAAEATTALRGILNAILGPSEQAVDALAAVGGSFDTVRTILASPGGLLRALDYLMTAANGDIEVMNKMFPEIRGLTGAFALLGQNTEKARGIIDRTTNSMDSLQRSLGPHIETLNFRYKQAWASLEVALIAVGEAIKPTAVMLLNEFSAGLTRLTPDIVQNVQSIAKSIIEIVAGISKIPQPILEGGLIAVILRGKAGLAAGGMVAAGGGLGTILTDPLKALSTAMKSIDDAIFSLTHGAFRAGERAGKSFASSLLGLKYEVSETGRAIIHITKPTMELFVSSFEEANEEVANFASLMEGEVKRALAIGKQTMEMLAVEMDRAGEGIEHATNQWEDFADGVKAGIANITAAGGAIGDLGDIGRRFGEDISNAFRTGLGETLFNVFKGQTDKLKDVWNNFLDDLLRAFSKTIADMAIKAAMESVLDPLKSSLSGFFSGLASGIGKLFGGGAVSAAGGGVDFSGMFSGLTASLSGFASGIASAVSGALSGGGGLAGTIVSSIMSYVGSMQVADAARGANENLLIALVGQIQYADKNNVITQVNIATVTHALLRRLVGLQFGMSGIADLPQLQTTAPGQVTSNNALFPIQTFLQHGGIVTRPTRALIGEAGPEAVIPLGRGLQRMMNITIQIIEPQISMEADLDRIAEMAAMKIGRKLSNPFFNLSNA